MILRKPYAFFIKMFKPMHLVLGILIGYLLYLENNMFGFLDKNIYTNLNFIGQDLKNTYVNLNVYIIPIIVIILFFAILTIMYKKKKPILFYLIGIFAMIIVLVINVYTVNFFKVLEESIVSIKNAKLIHDLVFISMLVESVFLIFVLTRGAGLNFQKFDFDSDISKIAISEKDNEEFELNIGFDFDKSKRESKRRRRYLKYTYQENKFVINIILILVLMIILLSVFIVINNKEKIYNENEVIISNNCSFKVNGSYIVKESYDGSIITDKSLLVVNLSIKKDYKTAEIYLKDFNVNINNATYTPTTLFNKFLIDLGDGFYDNKASLDYNDYLFIYEIEDKELSNNVLFGYNDGEEIKHIKLIPSEIKYKNSETKKSIDEILEFDNFGNVNFKINNIEINDSFILDYNYCITKNDCILSKEYIKPSINKNYDKTIIKLNIEYNGDDKLSKFYTLLNTYGVIEYKINDVVKIEKDIEEVLSNKLLEKNTVYLGVNNEIKNANEINVVFNIRGRKYIYKIK